MGDNSYYSKGYRKEVSDSHSWRNVENSLSFMVQYIKESSNVLDVGCGPGSITVDIASRVPKGHVTGIDTFEELISQGQQKASDLKQENVFFRVASATSLPFEDNSFDVVVAHQVLVHLADPEAAFREMRRVVKPDGVVCCKDGELDSVFVSPMILEPPIKYYFLNKATGAHTSTKGGSRNKAIALDCGFSVENVKLSCSTWCFSSDDERVWFTDLQRKRISCISSSGGDEFSKTEIMDAWDEWARNPNALLIFCHIEIVCRK
ncbi:Piso0_000008 [Millerozyma farinosa CBS 7064]|uniref:Piso0_000008 protein n=1 Tax=Pichia sorbitophila (strain ATCC MYA-4447 / BCRC 22081 / CBS 7064 / NBRC 10061 / NRRL Y-12695) TaxID=559304 RepID=G8YSU8_PICSO|nr:Piso0_000008 [Millerozyma farinosa CBS 7064]